MKAFIWVGCIFCASFVQVLLRNAGIILGALPVIALYGGMIASARFLCKKYEENRSKESTLDITSEEGAMPNYTEEQEERTLAEKTVAPPIMYCRKCGEKLVEGSDFCSYCGTAIIME